MKTKAQTPVWTGAAELSGHLVPVEDLHPHPDNPWAGNVDGIAASLERFGQVRMILALPDGTILAGNHTYLAARQIGWTHVAVVREDLDEAASRRYLLADNRLGDVGEYERAEMIEHLARLEATGRWEGTGYGPDDLDDLRQLEALAAAPLPDPPKLPTQPPPPVGTREVVLLLTEEQLAGFAANLRALRARYGIDDVTQTVLRAVRDEAKALNQGEAPDG